MGGRGAKSGVPKGAVNNAAPQRSDLELFKENARQFNEAIQNAKAKKAAIVEFTDMKGTTYTRYWNGATFVDRASALYEKDRKGTYKAKFKG